MQPIHLFPKGLRRVINAISVEIAYSAFGDICAADYCFEYHYRTLRKSVR
jgi:hypothetical protein